MAVAFLLYRGLQGYFVVQGPSGSGFFESPVEVNCIYVCNAIYMLLFFL
jgi:hypothetical protein